MASKIMLAGFALLCPFISAAAWAADDEGVSAVSPNDKVRAIAKEKLVSLIDVATGKEIVRIQAHTDTILALSFSPDGKILASGGKDQTVRAFEASTGKQLFKIDVGAEVRSIGFLPDGKSMSVLDAGKKLHIYDPATGKKTTTIEGDK